MSIRQIDEQVIVRLSKGEESAFSLLYDCYYTYLNTVALCYVFDKNVANEIVNDVFVNVWHKRKTIIYPIHFYLVQSVKNGCLNHIRAQQSHDRIMSEHRKQLLEFQEEYILSNHTPLEYIETKEIEMEVRSAVERLPEKCRVVFEQYFYLGKVPEDIATDLLISVSTVRVHIKNALDKLRISLKHLIGLTIFLIIKIISHF